MRCFQKSLAIDEQLHAANPNSAQAARDLLVSLERVSDALAGGDNVQALSMQLRALELAMTLQKANRGSAFYGRTAAVTFFRTGRRAVEAGDQQLAARCLDGCHQVLRDLVRAGVQLDPGMADLYR